MPTRDRKLPPTHPGQASKEVLDDAGITANALAQALRIPANGLTEIINGKLSISAGTVLRYVGANVVWPWKKAS